MSQTLIIHNDKTVVDLLNLNLPIYVGTDVIFKNNFKESKVLIEHHPGIHLIICGAVLGKEQTADELYKFNKSINKPIPLIVIGKTTKLPAIPDIMIILEVDLKLIIQAAAKFLKVTPKKMIEQAVPDFFPIGIDFCLNLKKAPCEIFLLNAEGQYQKLHEASDDIAPNEIKKLMQVGTDKLYVEAPHRLKFVNHVTTSLVSRLKDPNMTPTEQMSIADEAMQVVKDEAIRGEIPLSQNTQELTKAAINTCMEIAKNNPTVAGLLKKLFANKSSYIYRHTQLIIHISQHILSNIEWGSNEQKGKLAFVAFFHDICLTTDRLAMFSTDLEVSKDDTLSVMERDLIFRHAKTSAEIVQKFPVAPIGTDVIIIQHHGVTNGIGFAKTFTNSISPLAIVFIVAEELTNMILEIGESKNLASHKPEMIAKLNQKFTRSKYQKVVETLSDISFS